MEKLPIITIVTSNGCGACTAMRGEGKVQTSTGPVTIPGGNRWNVDFFKALISGGSGGNEQKFKVHEIHFPTLGPASYNTVDCFSEFFLVNGAVVRKAHIKKGEKIELVTENNGITRTRDTINTNLAKFLEDKIPKELFTSFLYKFPAFLFSFDRRQILLVGPLLVVEGKEKGFYVEVAEIFSAIEKWHSGIFMLVPDSHRVLRVDHFLVLLGQDVVERGFQQF